VNAAGDPVDSKDGFCIAWGRDSGGRTLWLNVVDGEIIEESLGCDTEGAFDVVEYFDRMRTAYRELKLIPGKGMLTMQAWDVEERRERIAVEEVMQQTDEGATDLDWQFVRQVYRDSGWPGAFREEEAAVRVEELLRVVWGEERYVWENTGDLHTILYCGEEVGPYAVGRRATITAALRPGEFEIPDPKSCVHTIQRKACPTESPVHHLSLFFSSSASCSI